jgi:tetratricopeptide (TPR) repeat protein
VTNVLALLITAALVYPLIAPHLPTVNLAAVNALFLRGARGVFEGRRRLTSAAAWALCNLCVGSTATMCGLCLRASVAADRGQTEKAVRDAEAMLQAMKGVDLEYSGWFMLNAAIDVFVNAGRYSRAVALPDEWSSVSREAWRALDPVSHTIAYINRAEALHNLGRNIEALASLAELDPGCQRDPVAMNGRALLRAWILAQMKRADEAQAELETVDPAPLGPRYLSEVLYTRSLVARERGDLELAVEAAQQGLAAARRASSYRNGLVVVAAAEVARGNHEVALDLLVAAAQHPYHGQSAGGRLLLGTSCERVDRRELAREAYTRALEQDPESCLCETIRARLRAFDTA